MHTSGIIPSPTSHSARSSHSTICSHRLRRPKSSPGGVHSRWHKKTSYDSSHIARRSQNATQSAFAGSTSAPIHSATVAQPAPVRRAFRTHCKRSKSPAAYCSKQAASQGACSSRSRQRCCSAQLASQRTAGSTCSRQAETPTQSPSAPSASRQSKDAANEIPSAPCKPVPHWSRQSSMSPWSFAQSSSWRHQLRHAKPPSKFPARHSRRWSQSVAAAVHA